MLGANNTPFSAIGFQQIHRNGSDMAVIAVRAAFGLKQNVLQIDDVQSIILVDEYGGDPQSTPLLRVSDLIPFKPAADITVIADSYPPEDGDAQKGWLAGVRLGDYRYAIRVHGARRWARMGDALVPGRADTMAPMSIDYRHSWGDLAIGELPGNPPPLNPLGVRRPASAAELLPMAQIESSKEDYSQPFAARPFQGFGPIPPFWRDRQKFAGTYDDQWLKSRHPLLPEDFDYRFYQCAHPRLICDGYLRGDETFELFRLSQLESVEFSLPAVQPFARFLWNDDRQVAMNLNLDGVHINARSPDIMIDLTWRGWLPICPNFFRIDLDCRPLDDTSIEAMPFSGIDGLEGVDASGEVIA
jgi:hypothetical protein